MTRFVLSVINVFLSGHVMEQSLRNSVHHLKIGHCDNLLFAFIESLERVDSFNTYYFFQTGKVIPRATNVCGRKSSCELFPLATHHTRNNSE